MNFEEYSQEVREEQLINYIKYLRELAESYLLENEIETMSFDKPGSAFVYLNFLKKYVDKYLNEKISCARVRLKPRNAKNLSRLVTDFNNMLLKNADEDFSNYSFLHYSYPSIMDGLEEDRK